MAYKKIANIGLSTRNRSHRNAIAVVNRIARHYNKDAAAVAVELIERAGAEEIEEIVDPFFER